MEAPPVLFLSVGGQEMNTSKSVLFASNPNTGLWPLYIFPIKIIFQHLFLSSKWKHIINCFINYQIQEIQDSRIRNKCLTSTCSGGSGNPIDRISFCGRGFLHLDQRKTSIILLSKSVVLSPFVTGGTWFTDLLLLLSISIASCDDCCADCCCEAWNALIVFSPAKQSSYLFAYKI